MSEKKLHPETLALHAGWRADPTTGAVAPPIFQTTSYQFKSTEHAANLFALAEMGNVYTRIMNPTTDMPRKPPRRDRRRRRWARGRFGTRRQRFSLQNLARAGDNVVASTDLYGGTWNLFANTLKDQGSKFASSIQPTRKTSAAPSTIKRALITPRLCLIQNLKCSPLKKSPTSGAHSAFR